MLHWHLAYRTLHTSDESLISSQRAVLTSLDHNNELLSIGNDPSTLSVGFTSFLFQAPVGESRPILQLIVQHDAILTVCSPPICPQTCHIHALIQVPDIIDNQTCFLICLSLSLSSLHLLYLLSGPSTLCT